MKSRTTFKCLSCKKRHRCDHRNRGRQHYCSEPLCRKASKSASQRRWLDKKENQHYFCGPTHKERVKRWRQRNPGYRRRKKTPRDPVLQDPLTPQAPEAQSVESSELASGLQDLCLTQPALLVGLISMITGAALQDDIASTLRAILTRGQDILRMVLGSPHPSHEDQTHSLSPPFEARASPV